MTEREIVIEQTPAERKAAERETWVLGSIPQLRRSWSGRCVTCANFAPPAERATHGACTWLGTQAAATLISGVGAGPILTAPAYGCVGWEEIVPEMTEVVIEHPRKGQPEIVRRELAGPIRARTEFAITAGLIDDVPVEQEPASPR